MTFYEELFRDLYENEVRYLVVGGMAVVLHGFVRMTADLDLMIALDKKNLLRFLGLMKSRGYRPKAPVPIDDFSKPGKRNFWKNKKGMMVFSLYHPTKPQELIDIFINEPIPFKKAYERKTVVRVGAVSVDVIGKEDLITLKKKAGRPQDKEDIKALKKGMHEN